MSKSSVRLNINLLDRAVFTPSRSLAKSHSYTDDNGFTIDCGKYTLPTANDMIVLLDILSLIQNSSEKDTLSFPSLYKLLKFLKKSNNMQNRRRVILTLRKWVSTDFEFIKNGSFNDTKEVPNFISFGVIERISNARKCFKVLGKHGETVLRVDKGIKIRFNKEFIEMCVNTFTRYIKLEDVKKLSVNPFALSLYKVLVKNFYNRFSWAIGIPKLYKKMAADYRKKSLAIEQITKAVEFISQVDVKLYTLNVSFSNDIATFKLPRPLGEKHSLK